MKYILYILLLITTSTLYASSSDSTTFNNEYWTWSDDMDTVGGNKLLNNSKYKVSFIFMNDGRYYFSQTSSGALLTTIIICGTYIYNVDSQIIIFNKTQQEASNTTQQQLAYSLPDTLFIDKMEPEYIQLRNNDSFGNIPFYANKNNKFMRQQNLDNIILLDKYSVLTNVSTMRVMKYNVDNEFHTLTDDQSKEIIQILNKAKYLRPYSPSLESDLDTSFQYIMVKSDNNLTSHFQYWAAHHIISIRGHLYSVDPIPVD